jgi:YidC/Oxa1 family membrane protein insertase
MITFFGGLITTFVYQPFFNLLVYIYLLLDKITGGHSDMGWAVIIFTVIFRVILLPMSLRGERSEKERREISQRVESVERSFRDDPVKRKEAVREIISSNKKVLGWEIFDLFVQVLIALMLYRIFTTGLEGTDLHLLYSFMPKITEPFNLVFAGTFDLSKPSLVINVINTAVIFMAEFLSIRFSPLPMTREDSMMLAVLPLGAFTFFAFMPAGKKLFVTTTLLFSILIILARQLVYVYHSFASQRKALGA